MVRKTNVAYNWEDLKFILNMCVNLKSCKLESVKVND